MRALLLLASVAAVTSVATAQDLKFHVEVVAKGLTVPWALAFPDKDTILVTERSGTIRVITKGKLRTKPLQTLPVLHRGEGGLMDIQLHPEYAKNKLLYVSYMVRSAVQVFRFKHTRNGLTDAKKILGGIPAARFHAGCRLGFGPDGKLYITTGDATNRRLAQQLGSLAGKTLRLNDDGTIPKDNPFVGRKGARPEIWSLGHRNAQGIDWHPVTKMMVQTEHGPSGFDGPGGGDEVNIVERAKNYGWPVIHHRATRRGMVAPLLEYTPAVAPASGTFYSGKAFPDAVGDYFFGCLRGNRIVRVVFDGRAVKRTEELLRGRYGRIREVAVGPDGLIYFTTSNQDKRGRPHRDDDRVLRLVPKP